MIVLTPEAYPLYAMHLNIYSRMESSPILVANSPQMAQHVVDLLNLEYYRDAGIRQYPPVTHVHLPAALASKPFEEACEVVENNEKEPI